MNRQFAEEYKKEAGEILASIQGLSPVQLTARPVATGWSIQQIVLHLMDTELIAVHRMRKIIAEENPELHGYDQDRFANTLFYEKADALQAASIIKQMRLMMASTLLELPDEAFERSGMHSEFGKVTLGGYVKRIVDHQRHHINFLIQKKEMIVRGLP